MEGEGSFEDLTFDVTLLSVPCFLLDRRKAVGGFEVVRRFDAVGNFEVIWNFEAVGGFGFRAILLKVVGCH